VCVESVNLIYIGQKQNPRSFHSQSVAEMPVCIAAVADLIAKNSDPP